VESWENWDPVMQEDYLAEIDLRIAEALIMEIRRQVFDKSLPREATAQQPS
jgi:hypothetical protein